MRAMSEAFNNKSERVEVCTEAHHARFPTATHRRDVGADERAVWFNGKYASATLLARGEEDKKVLIFCSTL